MIVRLLIGIPVAALALILPALLLRAVVPRLVERTNPRVMAVAGGLSLALPLALGVFLIATDRRGGVPLVLTLVLVMGTSLLGTHLRKGKP